MAFIVGTKNYVGGTDPVLPLPTAADRGTMLYNNGVKGYWNYPGNPTSAVGSGFEFRSVLTHGYLAGGYKGANPWRSVNKTWHSTDVTIYCGEQLEHAVAYQEGYNSDYNGYVTGAGGSNDDGGGTQATTSLRTVSCNLHTGNGRSRGEDTYSPAATFGFGSGANESGSAISQGTGDQSISVLGGWNGSQERNSGAAATNQIGQNGYVGGGSNAAGAATTTNKLHFGTEIMYSTTASPAGGFSSGIGGQNGAFWSFSGTKRYMTFSNDTYNAWTSSASADGWGKFLSTKKGFHYGSVGTSSVHANQIKFSDVTQTDIGSAWAKIRPYAEENCQMGQEHGYVLGHHDGAQNNHTIKYNYSTDAQTTLGALAMPKGHYGQSSGVCWYAAATITSAYQS
jgi:hypothetical protein